MKIRFIKPYLTYSGEMNTTDINGKRLISEGVAEEVKDKSEIIPEFKTKEEPKKRVRRTKAQIEADKK
tara:strand:- start:276 stop:479 length:204 start_codon:yes stop_codon:yes gene_type:complete